jgi:signal peptidase I
MSNKPRRPWIAAISTFASRGLGHVYAGEPTRGIIWFVIEKILVVVFSVLVIVVEPSAVFLLLAVLGSFAYTIFCAVDAARIAREKIEHYELAKYNRWFAYLGYFAVMSLLISSLMSTLIKTNLVEAYKIPSGAMIPTLLIGDHLLADKHVYKTSSPNRGDIIIFPYPEDPKRNFIKRLIAIEGDVVELRDGRLYLNGSEQAETYLNKTDDVSVNSRGNYGPVTVPAGMLFFLGDNRERSMDSRVYGFVTRSSIKGKAISLYWSWDNENHKVRWDRLGQIVR